MVNSRRKGHDGEREIVKRLKEGLSSSEIHRNWMAQSADGGADILLEHWAVEVKRAKAPLIRDWWTQAAQQAAIAGKKPVLIYRLDRQEWRAMISMRDLRPDLDDFRQVTLDLESFINLVRLE